MSKIIDHIIRLKADMKADWKEDLERINIWEDVKGIYSRKWSREFCNAALAFVVLAYDNDSGWIDIHKDRWANKEKIAGRLGMNIKEQKVKDIVHNDDHTINQVVAWFVEYQADWRWDAIISCVEYASEMMRFAKTKTQDKVIFEATHVDGDASSKKEFSEVDIDKMAQGNLKKGINLDKAIEQRRKADELMAEIKKEFVTLDNALQQEDRKPLTDAAKNIESWETYIANLKNAAP